MSRDFSRCSRCADVAVRGDEHAAHALLLEQVEVHALARRVLVGVAEQDGDAVAGRLILGAAHHVVEEWILAVEHDEPDGRADARPAVGGRRRCGRSRARSIACCTRATESGETSSGLLSTFETVPTETPASRATSRMLVVAIGSLPRQCGQRDRGAARPGRDRAGPRFRRTT